MLANPIVMMFLKFRLSHLNLSLMTNPNPKDPRNLMSLLRKLQKNLKKCPRFLLLKDLIFLISQRNPLKARKIPPKSNLKSQVSLQSPLRRLLQKRTLRYLQILKSNLRFLRLRSSHLRSYLPFLHQRKRHQRKFLLMSCHQSPHQKNHYLKNSLPKKGQVFPLKNFHLKS